MDSNHSSMDMPMSMRTTFYIGRDMTLIFNTWISTNSAQLFGAMLAIFVLGFLYEGLRFLREKLMEKVKLKITAKTTNDTEVTPIISGNDLESRIRYKVYGPTSFRLDGGLSICMYIVQALLQVVQVGMAYILMLAAMTYNGWIFMALVFGTSTGYLCFFIQKSLKHHNPL